MSTEDMFWQVLAIHDCDAAPGGGFGYTVGLASRDLPELHLWDRPTHGDDPAADFHLSSRDVGSILNELAVEWVSGQLCEGDRREIKLDGGLTTALFIVGAPVPAEQLEAWRAMPSLVVPLRWSLQRPARGAPVPVMDDDKPRYEADLVEVVEHVRGNVDVVGAYRPGDHLTFDVDERVRPADATGRCARAGHGRHRPARAPGRHSTVRGVRCLAQGPRRPHVHAVADQRP